MRTFFKDYWNLCQEASKFYRKHWLGIIIGDVLIWAGLWAYLTKKDKDLEKRSENED